MEKVEQHSPEQCFQEHFQYTHKNPYHQKLQEFQENVFRDKEGEAFKGKWQSDVFHNRQQLTVEIGSGFGEFMVQYLEHHPNENYIGIDYRFKRSYQVAKKLVDLGQRNPTVRYRFLRAKGERISFLFGSEEVSKLLYFFPDPWPKTRHHKKRLFQKHFLTQCWQILKPGGYFFIKTDHDQYYPWMLEHLQVYQDEQRESNKTFEILLQTDNLHSSDQREQINKNFEFFVSFPTKFEQIFLSQGKTIKALILRKPIQRQKMR